MKFKLQSNFKPAGDQPRAINELINGLNKGYRDQTLLGVTGSGKSLTGETPVLIKRKRGISQEKIGGIIDGIFSKYENLITRLNDHEIIDTSRLPHPERFLTSSFDPASKLTTWRPVNEITRHLSPTHLYKITLTGGREVVVTGDHNFFSLHRGELKLTKTTELSQSHFIPVPEKLNWRNKNLKHLVLSDYISDHNKIYVSLSEYRDVIIKNASKFREIINPAKLHNFKNSEERFSFSAYKKICATFPDAKKWKIKIGKFSRENQLSNNLPLSDDFLRLIGFYIAEGHAEKRYLIISSGDQEIVHDFSQTFNALDLRVHKRRWIYDFQISSTLLSEIFANMCGANSKTKRLPPFWPQLSQPQLSNLLKAYFSADGGVDGLEVACTTASRELASDLAYALSRFGIVARIQKRLIKLPGKNIRNEYWSIRVSGRKFLNIFKIKIGFTLAAKNLKLSEIIKDSYNTNTDLIPGCGQWIKNTRKKLNLSQLSIAKAAKIERSYISMIESGIRMPSKTVFKKIIKGFEAYADKSKDKELFRQIAEKRSLLKLHWQAVKKIEKIKGEKYVYDFSVKNYENFLAGFGGMFVHNTFTMANIIESVQKPTLIISHNKTLAAQLFAEFRQFFPENAVHYFVSYYDYYQPEAYIPQSDTYIEKEATINEEIDRLRHASTQSLMNRDDVIIVASVSCIYGLGDKADYEAMSQKLQVGQTIKRNELLRRLVKIQYERNDIAFYRGQFKVKGDTIDIHLATGEAVIRINMYGDEIEKITLYNIHPSAKQPVWTADLHDRSGISLNEVKILPAKHFMTPEQRMHDALAGIRQELEERLKELKKEEKLVEAYRLEKKTNYDLEMMKEIGYCNGIENYSRHLSARAPGEPPQTLIDFFPKDFLLFVDESHATLPQVRGMYAGDQSRKQTLIDFGFRLPSARDNRPLNFPEFNKKIKQAIYVSATPSEYEISKSKVVAEQIVRPTGLLDPEVAVRPTAGQIENMIEEIEKRTSRGHRVLVTTLTKRMAEELSEFLAERKLKVQYMHSEVETLERIEIIRKLRTGEIEVLVGINLLREGLDLPEVSMVIILDADMGGFLRNETSLIQTMGRAARHIEGKVIMYADRISPAMRIAIDITNKRRQVQAIYNEKHGITPKGIRTKRESGVE